MGKMDKYLIAMTKIMDSMQKYELVMTVDQLNEMCIKSNVSDCERADLIVEAVHAYFER